MTRYVLVGNSAGGIGAIEAIRQVDQEGSIVAISEEPYPAYSRPQIGRYLAGEIGSEQTLFRPRDFYPSNGVHLLLGRAVTGVELAQREVVLDGGQRISWNRLLLATGGTPISVPVKGLEQAEIFTFVTLDDAQRLKERASTMRHVLVIGAGLIGLTLSEALCKLKVKTTVIELAPQILGRALDSLAAAKVQALMESRGVRVLTNCSLTEVRRTGTASFLCLATLSNGVQIECDTIVMAIGVRPRVELAKQLGLLVNRGIVVDRHMRTGEPDIYACGDAAEAYDFVAGEARLAPIWPNAYLGGRIAGFNMAGSETVYGGGTAMNAIHFFGYPILSAGTVSPAPEDGCQVFTQQSDDGEVYKKVVLRNGKVVGFIFAGHIDRAGVVYGLMKQGMEVTSYADKLVREDFGLISLPPTVRSALLESVGSVRTL